MKKLAVVLAIWFCMSYCIFTVFFPEDSLAIKEDRMFVLPASLVTIEDGAFENTAAGTIILPEGLTRIGKRAFACVKSMRTILIPESVIFIDDFAFEGILRLKFIGTKGSYAEDWAQEHVIPFISAETIAAASGRLKKLLQENIFLKLTTCFFCPGIIPLRRRRIMDAWRSMRPQDRAELYPINYRFP